MKAHQPDWDIRRLQDVAHLQARVATDLGLAPAVLAGPARLGNGFAIVEECVERGSKREGHDSRTRRALAESLQQLVALLTPLAAGSVLPTGFLSSSPGNQLWPKPHSRLFDFEATREGAEYIEEIAIAARARRVPAGRLIIGHSDWRTEHVRFEGDRLIMGLDWDSLRKDLEPGQPQ